MTETKPRNSRGQNNSKSRQKHVSPPLEGECPELKEHVYTFGDPKQANRYHRTTEVIVNHIQKNFDYGQDTKDSLLAGAKKDLTALEPEGPTVKKGDPLTETQQMFLAQRIKKHVDREIQLDINFSKAFALILGQCTQGIKNKLESRKDWLTLNSSYDPIALLKALKEITLNYQDTRYHVATISSSLKNLLTMSQGETKVSHPL